MTVREKRPGRAPRLALAALVLVALAVFLAGCDFEEEFYPAIPFPRAQEGAAREQGGATATASHTHPVALELLFFFEDFEEFLEGEFEPISPFEAAIREKIVTGPLNAMVPARGLELFPRAAGGASASKTKPVRGVYIAALNGKTNSKDGTAEMTAVGAIDFKQAAQGVACFEMTAHFTKNGSVGKGTFRTTGGTKASATTRFSGSFEDTVSAASKGKKDKGKLKGKATFDKSKKAPPPACKALLKKLP